MTYMTTYVMSSVSEWSTIYEMINEEKVKPGGVHFYINQKYDHATAVIAKTCGSSNACNYHLRRNLVITILSICRLIGSWKGVPVGPYYVSGRKT